MWIARWLAVVVLMGCVGTPDGPPRGNGPYLMAATSMMHHSEEGLADALKENKAIFGGGEGCTQRVDESFVRKIEAFAEDGKPIASLKGMEWGGEFNLEQKTVGYIAIIVGPDQGRVALADAGALETREGRLFLLPDAVFEAAVKLIFAKLDGPNCPFQPSMGRAAATAAQS